LDNPKKEEKNQNLFTGNSLQRFEKTNILLNQYSQANSLDIVDYSFKILDEVKQNNFTQWSIVYDLSNLEVHFKTKSNPKISKIEMKKLNFSSATPCLILDLANSKNSTNFEKYSVAKNFGLINQVFDSLDMLKDIPQEMRAYSANYPDTTIFNDRQEKADNNR
jgi:choloylglycine hydrolase